MKKGDNVLPMYKEYTEDFDGIIESYLNGDRFGQFPGFFDKVYGEWAQDKEIMNPMKA